MKKNILSIVVFFIFIISLNSVFAISIVEPVVEDITFKEVVDIGLVAPGEQVLVSFFQGVEEKYNQIILSENSMDVAFLETTNKTKESIFTILNIKENVVGTKNIELFLIGSQESKKVILRTTITNDVIYAYTLPYEKKILTERTISIPIRLINKAASTKEIIITSDISKHWFSKEQTKTRRILLQPNSVVDIKYEYNIKTIDLYKSNIYVLTDMSQQTQITDVDSSKIIVLPIEIEIIKDLEGIQNLQKHSFSLYGLNMLPIHFFNNFLKYIVRN